MATLVTPSIVYVFAWRNVLAFVVLGIAKHQGGVGHGRRLENSSFLMAFAWLLLVFFFYLKISLHFGSRLSVGALVGWNFTLSSASYRGLPALFCD
jgi:hypothetical protein